MEAASEQGCCERCRNTVCPARSEERASGTQNTSGASSHASLQILSPKGDGVPDGHVLGGLKEWSVGLKGFGALKMASELGCSGWRTEEKRGTLGSPALHRHLLHIPFLPSLAPEARKEGGDRDTQLNGQPVPSLHTQTPAPNPIPTRSDPGLNPPSKQCGFRPQWAALGLVERAWGQTYVASSTL